MNQQTAYPMSEAHFKLVQMELIRPPDGRRKEFWAPMDRLKKIDAT